MTNPTSAPSRRAVTFVVLVAALGYFVDVYSIILFSAVRTTSLQSLGLTGDSLLSTGVKLLNMQMLGLLGGGILWGILGDKKGRLAILFGSILLYSLANIANGFVSSIELYALVRFVAGVGLAGELGGGITIVSEIMTKEKRGYGTTIIGAVGVAGGLGAAYFGTVLPWRLSYILGGAMGLVLLALRVSVHESKLFKSIEHEDIPKGDLRLIFNSRERLFRYVNCVCIGLPVWFVLGVIITFSPELGKALGSKTAVSASHALVFYTIGNVAGAIASGLFSQWLKSRKKAIAVFLLICLMGCVLLLETRHTSDNYYYLICLLIGFSIGYWTVLITAAAEQFGTNMRATVTTTVPNLVRGMTIPITFFFESLRLHLGIVRSVEVVGAGCLLLAFFSLSQLRETFSRNLDFVEVAGTARPELTVPKTS
jgi:putative MFS transporter